MDLRNPIDKVPKELVSKLLEAVERTRTQSEFAEADMKFFFDIWNGHINKFDKEDIKCRACRSKVVSKLRFYANGYKAS